MSRRVPDYYSPYSPQYPEDYQYYPPGVRPDSICSMPAYERVSPPWALEDKRHSFRNGGTYQLRDWKEHPSFGRQDVPLWLSGPGRQPTYLDEVDAASGSLRRMSLQPRSRSVPRSPSQGSYSRARVYSPVRSPSARFERLPPRGEEIYADPTTFMMRRSISSPKVKMPVGTGGAQGRRGTLAGDVRAGMLQDSLSALHVQPGLKMPPRRWLMAVGPSLPSCKAAQVVVVPSWLLLCCCEPGEVG